MPEKTHPQTNDPAQPIPRGSFEKEVEIPGEVTSTHGVVQSFTELPVAEEVSISQFQFVTYLSFVVAFCIAGFAAIVLYRKVAKNVNVSHSGSIKLLGAVFLGMAANLFYAANLYVGYLTKEISQPPLVWLLFFWVFAGPMISWVITDLLSSAGSIRKRSFIFNALTFNAVYLLTMSSVSVEFEGNTNLNLSLLACVLCVIPVGRFLGTLGKRQVDEFPHNLMLSEVLLLCLLIIVLCLFPLLGLSSVMGLSDEVYILISNLMSFCFVLLVVIAVRLTASGKRQSISR